MECNPEEQSSMRCKLSGILVGITSVEWVTPGREKCTITSGCDSSGTMSGVNQWKHTRHASRCMQMQGGKHSDILQEIRAVLKWLLYLKMTWFKVKAHLKRPPESVHEVLHEKMDSLANSVHQNHRWQARPYAQSFGSATV